MNPPVSKNKRHVRLAPWQNNFAATDQIYLTDFYFFCKLPGYPRAAPLDEWWRRYASTSNQKRRNKGCLGEKRPSLSLKPTCSSIKRELKHPKKGEEETETVWRTWHVDTLYLPRRSRLKCPHWYPNPSALKSPWPRPTSMYSSRCTLSWSWYFSPATLTFTRATSVSWRIVQRVGPTQGPKKSFSRSWKLTVNSKPTKASRHRSGQRCKIKYRSWAN